MQKNYRRKNYYVRYYRDFANTYTLRWCYGWDKYNRSELEKAGYERITYKRAVDLIAQEVYRQKYDQSMSGYADDVIYPCNYDEMLDDYDEPGEYSGRNRYYRDGHIILRY